MLDPVEYNLIEASDLLSQEADIEECPDFKALNDLWHNLHAKGSMPLRSDFTLSHFGKNISRLSVWQVVYDSDGKVSDLRLRIHSTEIVEEIGDFTGKSIDDLPEEFQERTRINLQACLLAGKPILKKAKAFSRKKFTHSICAWLAPVSSTGDRTDRILVVIAPMPNPPR